MTIILFLLLELLLLVPWVGAVEPPPNPSLEDVRAELHAYFNTTAHTSTYAGIDMTPCVIMSLSIEKALPPGALAGPRYRKYRSFESYQLDLMNEMCLAYYLMQQPRNHGMLTSHGAPNF